MLKPIATISYRNEKSCGSSFITPQGFMKMKEFYAKESVTIPNDFRQIRKGDLYRLYYKANIFELSVIL
jgi:hypothetical protein